MLATYLTPIAHTSLPTQVEDLADENTVLRRKAGVGESDKVDTKDVRMQKEATIAQLRSLNALLERQVCALPVVEPSQSSSHGLVRAGHMSMCHQHACSRLLRCHLHVC